MSEINEKIQHLEKRLENLVRTQIGFQQEISQIRNELKNLRESENFQPGLSLNKPPTPPQNFPFPPPEVVETAPKPQENVQETAPKPENVYVPAFGYSQRNETRQNPEAALNQQEIKGNIEKFIGENLLSKIGIVVLVLGVAIGAKYAIDNNLISPLMRIILGYVFGFGLLGFAYKLKEKYLNFSAVLLSGAMAIMYFITFFGYSLYGLFPQTSAFVLMLIFTIFTVVSALLYNRQVIAQIGLVGAYAIPFLLSNNSGNYSFLLAYIAIINIGILAISVKKYWKSLHFSSFIVTWLIFLGWFVTKYNVDEHFNLALLFLTINFLTFYVTFIIYKIINLKHVAIENISLILANSLIFFGLGYSILNGRSGFENYLGMFTIANAAIHFAFALTISRLKGVPQDLVYLLSALVLTFSTVAVPVQLDGNFVTLIWTVEAAILFWIGRTKGIILFETYSFPLMVLAVLNLTLDWVNVYESRNSMQISALANPFYNGTFFTSLLFAAAFFFIHLTNRVKEFTFVIDESLRELFGIVTFAVSVLVVYNAFRLEISNYIYFLTVTTAISNSSGGLWYDPSLELFNVIWQINYTMLFLSILSFINIGKLKNVGLAAVNLFLNLLTIAVFITVGLFVISELRQIYILQSDAEFFSRGILHIFIRYISYIFAGGLILSSFIYLKQEFVRKESAENARDLAFDVPFFVSLLFILSSELLHWMSLSGFNDSYKLGLSILWGVYALFLIIIGIYRHKKHLRIGAIALFGITLAKLFFYDIAELGTISKTIVFVSMGILLLIVSFLYNKYKSLIFGEENSR
ncbi:MAG: DUF2339 domain-containing protein [Pyrinomonadaceae bacterium]|nr:DUF2339 domain-containing protein [Pyrinomonadaceae bacterium]